MVANKTSKYLWAYQAAVGTAIITAVNSLSYEFGDYNEECGKWNSPFVENPVLPSWVYSSRTPTLTEAEREFPIFPHVFLPISIQFLAWMLGKPDDTNDPVLDVTTLDTDMTYPLTIRNEEDGGTHPDVTQAVDCYCIGLTVKCERSKSMLAECQFIFGDLEDIHDTRPILTTAPSNPGGALIKGPYDGNPIVEWNGTPIPGVWRVDFKCEKEHEKVSTDTGTKITNYTYKMKPVQIILSAVFEVDDIWDDYIDRVGSYEMTVQVKKHNATNYITFTFHNCRVITYKKTGDRNKAHYGTVAVVLAEKVTGAADWFTEYGAGAGAAFATHFKAAI